MQETQEIWIQSQGWEDPLEEEMATRSSMLAWRSPWTEQPGRLQSSGSQRVRHDLMMSTHRLNKGLLSFYTHFSFLPLEVPEGSCTLHISVSPSGPTVRFPAPHWGWSEGQWPYLALSKCCCLEGIWTVLKSTLDIVKIICREPLEKSVNSCYSDQLGPDY